ASALDGSVSVDVGMAAEGILLPSTLRDRTDLEQTTFEARISSVTDGRWQWLFGAFFSDTKRDYRQRLPTPGYAAFLDAALGAGTSASVANGYDLDSPYNSDL